VIVIGAITLVLGDGTKDWTLVGSAEGIPYNFEFKRPVRLADTTALVGNASAGGGCFIDVEGFVS